MLKTIHNKYFYTGLIGLAILGLAFFVLPNMMPKVIVSGEVKEVSKIVEEIPPVKVVKHVKTPEAVKAIYMTACVAGTPSFRAKLVKLANETEINSIVLDIKDYTGTISFDIDQPQFKDYIGTGCRVADMEQFIETLHDHDIYVIGRITAFQDPLMTKAHSDWAVKKNSDRSAVWHDRKGLSFVDAGARPAWERLADLALASYAIGFDEINFDYIRFPSDGNMKDIYYPWSEEIWAKLPPPVIATSSATTTPTIKLSPKALVMESFFKFLHEKLRDSGMKLSVDFFGMTATNYDDLNIGQVLETAVPYFDYIAPMVYPSHYPVGFMGYKSVAEVNAHPYDIVHFSMLKAVERVKAVGGDPLQLRPWLQDNDYPVPYTPAMVRAQIQATYDAGLTSWMLWDAGNTYTQAALMVQ